MYPVAVDDNDWASAEVAMDPRMAAKRAWQCMLGEEDEGDVGTEPQIAHLLYQLAVALDDPYLLAEIESRAPPGQNEVFPLEHRVDHR
jgi:hypothetical protein